MILRLVRKDLLIEFRKKETFLLLVSIGALLAAMSAAGLHNAFIPEADKAKLFPAFVWLIFVLTATLAVTRTLDYEFKERAQDQLILQGTPPSAIFLSKICSASIIIFAGHLITSFVLSLLSGFSWDATFLPFALLSLLVVIAYSSLAILLSCIALQSKISNVLLPVMLLPLLFPLFFAAVELSADLFANGALNFESVWMSLLIGLDVLYIVLGINLYEHVLSE